MESPSIHAALVENSLTDTQLRIVAGPDSLVRAPDKNHRMWAIPLAVAALLGLVSVSAAQAVSARTFHDIKRPLAVVPASAQPVESIVKLSGVSQYPSKGEFLFVTIRQPELSLLSWLMFRHDKTIDPRTYVEVYGDGTPQQQSARGSRQMVSAKQSAEYVALTKLGFPIDLVPGEIIIDDIVCLKANADKTACAEFAPSGKVLKKDDKLLELDGHPIDSVNDIAPLLKTHKSGDMITVKYERPGITGAQSGTIEVVASPEDAKRVIVGFFPVDTTQVGAEPFPVSFDTSGIGGPSAGLSFTLTLIDELTAGDLTGGKQIAVTGTINTKGEVGAIGGLPQKASAVAQTGTKYFIVPTSQGAEDINKAQANAPGVTIIPVATLDEALAALTKLGGNGDELGTPGTSFVPAG